VASLAELIARHGFTPEAILRVSRKLERSTPEDVDLLLRRAAKRRLEPDQSYERAEIPKPTRSGRGVGLQALRQLLRGGTVPRKARAKVVRALNALLATKGAPALEVGALRP
jgi:hypothetical protein